MKKIREVLRLKWDLKCSNRKIASSIGISSSTVSECIKRAERNGLSPARNRKALLTAKEGGPSSLLAFLRGDSHYLCLHMTVF